MSEKRRVKIAVQADSVEWVLVRFVDDHILSTPLRIDKVIDENSGDDGMEANLQSGDMCLAPYSDGNLYKAKILLRTADKEKALKDRRILMTANPEREKKGRKSGPKKGEKKSSKKPKAEESNDHENKRTKKEILEEKKARDNSRTETLLHAQDYILKHVRNFDNSTSPSNQATPPTLQPPSISYSTTATAQTNIAPPSTNPQLISITPSYPPATSATPSYPPATPTFPPATSATLPSFPPATSATPSYPPATPTFPPATSATLPSFPPATSATPSYPPATPSFPPATSATPPSFPPATSGTPPSFPPATSATLPSFPPATSATPPSFPPATSGTPPSFPPATSATQPSFPFAAETFIAQPLSSPLSTDQPVDQSPAPISCSFTASYPLTPNTAKLPPSSSYPPTFNTIHSQSLDLPSSYTSRPPTSYQSPFPLSNDFSSQHTNTSDVLGRSLITLNNDCYECSVKDVQIESLKQALNQSTKDNGELLLRVQELERERKKPGSTQEGKDSEVKDHYTPKRGIIVDWSDYLLLDIGKEAPPNYERLTEEGEVLVPRQWLTGILGKCKGKGRSFTIKKFIDGFFEPEDLVGKTSVTFVPKNKVAHSLKMYAIKKLGMREADFNVAFNSKAQTAKRAIKFRRREIPESSTSDV